MKDVMKKVLYGVVALLAFCSLGQQVVFPLTFRLSRDSFRVALDKRYGDERFWNEYEAMAIGINGETLIAALAHNAPDASDSDVSRLLLWKIDQKGVITNETEIKRPQASGKAAAKSSVTAAIKDLTVLENGDALLIVDFESAHPSIVRVDRNGKQGMTKSLTGPDRMVRLFKIIPTSEGKFLLIGHESLDAFAMEVDRTGNVLWERKTDRGKMDLFVDGMATEDGGFVLVGNSGEYNPLRGGPSDVWVGRYDANGVEKTQTTFLGRYGGVSRSQEGTYGVVYDKANSDGQDIRLKLLSSDLKELWESRLLTVTPGFLDFKIAALPNGEFIVVGGEVGKLFLTRVGAKGENLGTFQRDAADASIDIGNYGLTRMNGEVIVASSVIDIREKTKVTRKVRIIKLSL